MATVRQDKTDESFRLSARTLVGRSPSCLLRLTDSLASGEHAILSYTGSGWELRDLGSKNGSFVDGMRVQPGTTVAVHQGAIIGFGAKDGWVLEDASAPPLLAVDLATAEVVCAVDGVLVLPTEDDPQASVYETKRGEFIVESEVEPPRKLGGTEVLSVGGRVFRIEPPDIPEGTPFAEEGPAIGNVTLRFHVSRNEEHVDLVILHGDLEIPLPRREHLYVLLTLARLRLEDADEAIAERGWVDRDELQRMLAMGTNALDVAIFRVRRQLTKAGIEGAAEIVEVRPGQRRICTDRIEIV